LLIVSSYFESNCIVARMSFSTGLRLNAHEKDYYSILNIPTSATPE